MPGGEAGPVDWVVDEAEAGERIDRALARVAGVPRARVQRWIEAGRVVLNGEPARASQHVAPGDRVRADPPEPVEASVEPEPIPLSVLHEDADLIVIDKPAGLVVHPAPGHPRGTLVNALLHHCGDLAGIGGVLRPGIVHRLDRGTSGVMVAAKHDAAHEALAAQFHDHTIERVYLALVRGLPGADAGRVARPIGRHRRDRKRMSVASAHGRDARTSWTVLERHAASGTSWLEVRPETGRTHQIRVHLSSSGMPLVGDAVYGRGARAGRPLGGAGRPLRGVRGMPALERPALHAAVLGFDHPKGGERMRFEAPLPPDLGALLDWLRRREAGR